MMNLRDIAQLSGVSRSTVSRVINDDPRVSDEVRARVKAIIEREGYHPHAAARALATRRSGVFGLVIPQALGSLFGDPWFPRFTQGCLDAAREIGVTLMLLMEPADDPVAVGKLIDRLVVTRHIDGLVLAASMRDDMMISALAELGFPYMLVGRPRDEGRNFVDVRNREASADATRHLLGHGRTRPAMIAGPDYMISASDRRAGFEDAVCEAGFDLADVPIRQVDFSQREAYNEALALLGRPDRPDAIFAASDAMAFGVLQAARKLGIRVPEDLGLMGFDGFEPDRIWYWELSTVRQPAHGIGYTAVTRLNDIVNHRTQGPEHVWLETELVVRHSCGCDMPVPPESLLHLPEKGGAVRPGLPGAIFVAESEELNIDRP
ncbi:MAG TPA: LacI family DNA-binding transcriptional regulator [Thermomicrobiales bacterium]|nr:LacI family DNA-binding transcriptional regulator [Thermomicrobiales bacterium]